MRKHRLAILLIVLLVPAGFMGCGPSRETTFLKKFAADSSEVLKEYHYSVAESASTGSLLEARKKKVKTLRELLKRYKSLPASDEAELLRSKILMECGQFQQAGEKIDALLKKESFLGDEVKSAQLLLLVYQKKDKQALELLTSLKDKLASGKELLSVYLYFALHGGNEAIQREYARKFLDDPLGLSELEPYKADVYRVLADLDMKGDKIGPARRMLENAKKTARREDKTALEARLKQMELLGKPVPDFTPDSWLTSSAPAAAGKVRAFVFWAPWDSHSRDMLPAMTSLYQRFKEKKFRMAGVTRLYGIYSDGSQKKERLARGEEINLLKDFIRGTEIPYPVALSAEGAVFEAFRVFALPTVVIVDASGKVRDIYVGTGRERMMEEKINRLLEEGHGKN